jgi:hypothetical protein
MATHTVNATPGAVDLLDPRHAYTPAFPASWAVPVAAATLWDAAGVPGPYGAGYLAEGPAFFVSVSPGSLRFRRLDLAKAEHTAERCLARRGKLAAEYAGWADGEALRLAGAPLVAAGMVSSDQLPDERADPLRPGKSRTRIFEWSRQSRANMTRVLTTLDYEPLVGHGRTPAMVTLTYPGDWLRYAPQGSVVKRHLNAFKRRYLRDWGHALVGVWKLEFQQRGAPHVHILMAPPHGAARNGLGWSAWMASAWVGVVNPSLGERAGMLAVHSHRLASADYAEGLRASDPKRIAIYFTKHGLLSNKEYQHIVPEAWSYPGVGPGRFWGRWGLDVVERLVPVEFDQAVTLSRTLRRWAAAQKPLRVAVVPRVDTGNGLLKTRKVRRRVKRLRCTWGFLSVNDGPAIALQLARVLTK